MIFVDSNVPMYLVGAEHPNKARAAKLLTQLIERQERLVTDAEVFQEILHRYTAIRRHDAIAPAWEALAGVVDETFDVDLGAVEQARDLLLRFDGLSSRDAVHAATMARHGVREILSFDTGFDVLPDLVRIG